MTPSVRNCVTALRAVVMGSSCLVLACLVTPARALEACVGMSVGQCYLTVQPPLWKTASAVEILVRNGAPQVLITGNDASGVGWLWANGVAQASPSGFVGARFSTDASLVLGRKNLVWWWWRPDANTSGQLPGTGSAEAASDGGGLIVGEQTNGSPLTWRLNVVKGAYDDPVALPILPGDSVGFAADVTPDGKVIVGLSAPSLQQPSKAVRWTLVGSAWTLETLGITRTSAPEDSSAYAVDASGNTIVGSYLGDDAVTHAFIWRKGAGWEDLGALGARTTSATDIRADGRIVVGLSNGLAFRWTQATGMKDLNLLLKEAGVNMGSITLLNASRISRDGEWIVAKVTGSASYVVRYADGLGAPLAGVASPEALRDSATELVRRRAGSMAQMQAHATPMIDLPWRLLASGPAQGSVGPFAAAGSASGGVNGRWFNGEGLTLRGGLAALSADSPGVDLRSAFMAAGAANYVSGGFRGLSPFVEAGGYVAPRASLALQRSYMNAADPVTVKGRTTGAYSQAFASLGAAFDVSKDTQAALSIGIARYGLDSSGYAEAAGAANPFNATMSSGRDSMRAVKFGGQVTHQLSDAFDLGLRAAVARGAKPSSSVRVAVAGAGESTGDTAASDWLEYGARLGYRIDQRMSLDAFFSGVTGDRHMGRSLHAGLGLRVGF